MTPAPQLLHRSAHILVANKGSGLCTTPSHTGDTCLLDLLRAVDPTAPALHACSRLDRPVSGVVLCTRTRAAGRQVLRWRQAGTLARHYLAIAHRAALPAAGIWNTAIGIDPVQKRLRRALSPGQPLPASAKAARTHYRVLAQSDQALLLHFMPQTGRTHQLRVHAAAAGAPLWGDVSYGGQKRCTSAQGHVVHAARVMLHAYAVLLPDEALGPERRFIAPVPADMQALWTALGGTVEALTPSPAWTSKASSSSSSAALSSGTT